MYVYIYIYISLLGVESRVLASHAKLQNEISVQQEQKTIRTNR